MAGPQRPLPGCPRGLSLSGPTPLSAPSPPDSCGKGRQGPCPQGQAALPWPQQHPSQDSGRSNGPAPHNLPRTLETLLTTRPLGCDVHGRLVPNQPQWTCNFRGLRTPEGTAHAVLAAARAARRAVTGSKGRRARARSLPLPQPSHPGQARGLGPTPAYPHAAALRVRS